MKFGELTHRIVAVSQYKRAAVARNHHLPWLLAIHHADTPRALEARHGLVHGREHVTALARNDVPDQLRDNLRIRLRAERDAFVLQLLLDLGVVRDGAVVHNGDAIAHVQVRMRVLVRLTPVRRPARVRDAHGVAGVLRLSLAKQVNGVRGAADGRKLGCDDGAGRGRGGGHARRVVAAVLQDGEPLEQERGGAAVFRHRAHNAARLGILRLAERSGGQEGPAGGEDGRVPRTVRGRGSAGGACEAGCGGLGSSLGSSLGTKETEHDRRLTRR